MATNRDIVATRKLNKENKARLGRGGDTKVRKVAGRDSHVNALEAYLIDVDRKAGEEYTKRVGAGTVNPLTGMPEYHTETKINDATGAFEFVNHTNTDSGDDMSNWREEDDTQEKSPLDLRGIFNKFENLFGGVEERDDIDEEYWKEKGELTFDQIKNLTPTQRGEYLEANYGYAKAGDYEKYFTDIQDEPFEFLREQKTLTTEALGRTAGRGLTQATGAATTAASKSDLATSGTITSGLETQKKQLFQDYAGGIDVAGFDFRKGKYAEEQRQKERFYAEIGAMPF